MALQIAVQVKWCSANVGLVSVESMSIYILFPVEWASLVVFYKAKPLLAAYLEIPISPWNSSGIYIFILLTLLNPNQKWMKHANLFNISPEALFENTYVLFMWHKSSLYANIFTFLLVNLNSSLPYLILWKSYSSNANLDPVLCSCPFPLSCFYIKTYKIYPLGVFLS